MVARARVRRVGEAVLQTVESLAALLTSYPLDASSAPSKLHLDNHSVCGHVPSLQGKNQVRRGLGRNGCDFEG